MMSPLRLWSRGSFVLIAASLCAGCAQHGAAILPPGSPASAPAATAIDDGGPPPCKSQKTTKNYASVTARLSAKGGSFCIPAYGGFGGNVKYPGANPSVKLKVTSSTKNYNHQPNLGKGTPIFYLQLAISGATTFRNNGGNGGGLTGEQIRSGKPYTAYGQATVYGFKVNFGPCYTVATKGKYGGVIGGIGSLLNGQSIPVAAKGIIEIYAGKQTRKGC